MSGENKKPELKLVVDNTRSPEVDIAAAADSGERLLSSGHDDHLPAVDKLSEAEREKRAIESFSQRLAILTEGLNKDYNALEQGDINAAKLYKAFLFVSQAGSAYGIWIDYFLRAYTESLGQPDPKSVLEHEQEMARLISSLLLLEEAFEVTAGGDAETTSLNEFKNRQAKSRVWESESRSKKIMEGLDYSHKIATAVAAKEGQTPSEWLMDCDDILTRDGMHMEAPKHSDGEAEWDEFDRLKEKLTDKAWQAVMPPPSRKPW